MQGLDLTTIVALTVALAGIIVAILAGRASSRAREHAWTLIAVERRQRWHTLDDREKQLAAAEHDVREWEKRLSELTDRQDVPYGHLDEYWGSESAPREQGLLIELARIEQAASTLLHATLGTSSSPQTLQIRTALRQSGVWTDEDVATFDRAMYVRNNIVHGTESRISTEEPTKAKLAALARKIDAAIGEASDRT